MAKAADGWISEGVKLFQRLEATTENERRPTVAIDDKLLSRLKPIWAC